MTDLLDNLHSEQEEFLSGILNAVPDLLFVFDFQTLKVAYSNRDMAGSRRLVSTSSASTVPQADWSECIHSDDLARLNDPNGVLQELTDKPFSECILRFKTAEGDWQHFYARCSGLGKQANGLPRYAVVAARDIADQLDASNCLADKEQQYRVLAENLSDIVCTTDEKINIDYVSPSVESVLG
ncbi:MAG: hypothetical protein ACR2PS_14765, partial [Pseudomonadales bacterium]